jgi:hypothetical protein
MEADTWGPLSLRIGAETLTYDEGSGDVTCPDGSTENIGADYGGCAELKALIHPSTGACKEGWCS